jgi:hypothetical protein
MKYSVKTYLVESSTPVGYEVEYIQGSKFRKITNSNIVFDRDGRGVIVYIGDANKQTEVVRFKDYKEFKTTLKKNKKKFKDLGVEFNKLDKCEWSLVSGSTGPGGRDIDVMKCDKHGHTKTVYRDSNRKVR